MTATEASAPAPEELRISVGGMTCAGCAATLSNGIGQLDGVASADVNVATRRATVKSDGTIDADDLEVAIEAAINGLGYSVVKKAAPAAGPDGNAQHGEHADHGHSSMDQGSMDHGDHAGMDLADEHLRADASRVADYRRRFTVAAILAAPLLAISMVTAWQFDGGEWLALALATPVIFWSAWPFHRSTFMTARHGATTMDTLVTLGTLAAWTWSTVVLVGGTLGIGTLANGHVYYETGAVIVSLILLGKWLEVRSTAKAGDAIRALSKIQANTAQLEDGTEIPLDQLEVGMRFVTRPGETIATDGLVVDGSAAVDASMVTGESVPVHAGEGAEVVGGTIATDGALVIEATRVGSETMLAQIARMVDDAQSGKADVQRLADRISGVFVPVVIGMSLATLATWLLVTGDVDGAFTAAVAVLIISCPCALGLATPLAIMVGTGRGAQLGVLVRGPQVLEDTRRITTIVLDKTGTITTGKMTAGEVIAPGFDDGAKALLISAAASAEKRSEHPVGQAVAALVDEHRGIKDFRITPGQGVTATVQGAPSTMTQALGCADEAPADVRVGSRRMFDHVPDELEQAATDAEWRGFTAVFAGRSPVMETKPGAIISIRTPVDAEAVILVSDTVKPTSLEAADTFRELGLDVILLTGDNERAARAVANEVGIDRVIAEVLPSDKAEVVKGLQEEGQRVAMVGDGVNDAPALAQADLGIAIGTGADVAREASDLTAVSGDLLAVADAIRLSRCTLSVIRGNLFWAFAYNVAAIPLAAFGILNPMVASAAMGGSSLFVVGNSLRLRGFTPQR